MKLMQGLESKGCMKFMHEGCMKIMHTRVHDFHAPKGNHPKGNHQRAVSVWELASLVPDGLENPVTLTARSRKQLNPVGDQQTACAEIGTASSPTASASTRIGVDLIDASGVDRLRNGGLEQGAAQGCERNSRRVRLANSSRVMGIDREFPKKGGGSVSHREASPVREPSGTGSEPSASRSATKAGHL